MQGKNEVTGSAILRMMHEAQNDPSIASADWRDKIHNTMASWRAPKNINFVISQEQALQICNYFKRDINNLTDGDVCSLLDNVIDDYCN
jgi:hypothetical protein